MLAAMRPSGSMMVLLGDFTGHGLPAAVGAMPLAATFYGMVPQGFAMTDILREMNTKLKSILPVGIFCCATLADINYRKPQIRLRNRGLPEACAYHSNSLTDTPVGSCHPP